MIALNSRPSSLYGPRLLITDGNTDVFLNQQPNVNLLSIHVVVPYDIYKYKMNIVSYLKNTKSCNINIKLRDLIAVVKKLNEHCEV